MIPNPPSIILGTQQSPIDVTLRDTVYAPKIAFPDIEYTQSTAIGKFEKHDFLVENHADLLVNFEGRVYHLVKIHFHDGCEHTIDKSDISNHELHLVHELYDGDKGQNDKLVIAVFFKELKTSQGATSFVELAKAMTGDQPEYKIKLDDFVPEKTEKFLLYQGSLTSYPYTEDVTWILNLAPEKIDSKTVELLRKSVAEQPERKRFCLNRRFVLRNFEKV